MSVKTQFFKDLSYIAIAKYAGIFIGILISAILARMLTPDDYGVVAIATVIIAFFSLFTDLGIGPAIIQNQSLSESDIKELFGITFWMGFFLMLMFYFASAPISSFYNQPILKEVCRILSFQLFISSLNIVPNALLSKSKKFDIIAIRTVSLQVLCGIVSIIAALKGLGVYALCITPILSGILVFAVNEFFLRQPISFIPSLKPINKIFSFSAYQFLATFVSYLGNNISSLLIGKFLPISELGYFDKATRVIQIPLSNINGVLSPVLLPYLSDSQSNPAKMFDIFKRINKILVTVAFPIAAILCICSKEIILVLYGPQWTRAIPCFAIMSLIVSMQISSVSIAGVLMARGLTKDLFYMGNINTIVSIIGLIIGVFVFQSIEGVAIMGVVSSTWSAIYSIHVGYKRSFNENSRSFFVYSLKPLSFFVFIVIFAFMFDSLFKVNIFISLFVKILFWLFSSFAFFHFFTEYKPSNYVRRIIGHF